MKQNLNGKDMRRSSIVMFPLSNEALELYMEVVWNVDRNNGVGNSDIDDH